MNTKEKRAILKEIIMLGRSLGMDDEVLVLPVLFFTSEPLDLVQEMHLAKIAPNLAKVNWSRILPESPAKEIIIKSQAFIKDQLEWLLKATRRNEKLTAWEKKNQLQLKNENSENSERC